MSMKFHHHLHCRWADDLTRLVTGLVGRDGAAPACGGTRLPSVMSPLPNMQKLRDDALEAAFLHHPQISIPTA
jgi:hypothetical protein